MILIFSIVSVISVSAKEIIRVDQKTISKVIEQTTASAIMTNTVTGEKVVLEVKPVSIVKTNSLGNDTFTVGYEVFAPISTGITPFSSEGGTKTKSGATAKLNVDYTLNTAGDQIKVTKLYGGWSGTSSLYYFTDRLCAVTSGMGTGGKQLEKEPTSNSFSYSTGWGYNDRIGGDIGPHAWSDVVAWIAGMESSGGIAITVQFAFPSD